MSQNHGRDPKSLSWDVNTFHLHGVLWTVNFNWESKKKINLFWRRAADQLGFLKKMEKTGNPEILPFITIDTHAKNKDIQLSFPDPKELLS